MDVRTLGGAVMTTPRHVRPRRIKPLAMGLTISGGTVVVINILHYGLLHGSDWGFVLAALQAFAVVCLTYGWARPQRRIFELGLLVASGAWIGRAVLAVLVDGWAQYGTWLSLGWAVAAGGAFLLEKAETNGGPHVSGH
jgi:hypothetical protein